ncbi:hypothetical protein SLS60_006396 [Paraconiothyrium brasiliense]|uniref:Uncharacterized protein n=1 Tax=Paraconiothyrium brasiliense TaxID=300254 RepID=A0ABR3RAL4_9PLEO
MVPASSSSTEKERYMGKASEEPELEPDPIDVDVDLQVPEGSKMKTTRRSVEDFEGQSRHSDAAAMYRETEPAWRRPLANSTERSARPSNVVLDGGPRSSARELGPPPSARGFDKINGIAATIEPGRSEARAPIRVPSPEYMTSIGNSQISEQQFGEPQAVAVMPISPSQASMPPPPDPQVNEERSKLEMPLFTKEEIEQKQAEDAKFTRLEQLLDIQQRMRIEKQAAKGKMEQKQAGGAYLARLEQMLNEVQQSGVKNEAAEGKMELQVEDAKFARLEHLLIEQMQQSIKKEAAKLKATEEATAAAAAAKLKGDEDKLEKLEKLILAQKEEQLKREEAVEVTRKADKADQELAKSLEATKAQGNMEKFEELEKPILATEEQPKRREAGEAAYKSDKPEADAKLLGPCRRHAFYSREST